MADVPHEALAQRPSGERKHGADGDSAEWARRLEILPSADGLQGCPTPLAALDLDTLEGNIAKMASFFAGRTARVRPHVKTHKCSAIARLQVAAHRAGVTCSTTDEAEAMVAAGIDDVLLANVVTDPNRLQALAALARRATVTVAVDSPQALSLLSAAAAAADAPLGVVIERDIGMGRNGTGSLEEGLRLAEEISLSERLELRGVMAYEGHLVDIEDREERARMSVLAFEPVLELLAELRGQGWDAPMLTGSSSATYDSTGALPEMTDVQAGTYVVMDGTYHRLTPEFEPAFAVIASVLTSRRDGTIVLDIGAKRLGTDWGDPRLIGAEAEFRYTAEEHSVFLITGGRRPVVGERIALVPGHACTTLTRYRSVFACRGGQLEQVLDIDGRDPLD